MKMALDNPSGVNVIRSYEPGRVQIREKVFTRSLIVSPDRLLPDWQATAPGALRATHLRPIIDLRPEVVLLGTGEIQVFPEAAIFTALMDLGIGFEIMDNAAACRTYNILIAEDRRAALALVLNADRD